MQLTCCRRKLSKMLFRGREYSIGSRTSLQKTGFGLSKSWTGLTSARLTGNLNPQQPGGRRWASSKGTPKPPKFDVKKFVDEISAQAELLAKQDDEKNPRTSQEAEEMQQAFEQDVGVNEEPQFNIDPEQVNEIKDYAKTYWKRYKNLPTGWRNNWDTWDNLLTFYYPSPYYFLLVPQIDIIVNVRYAIPGETRPIMFNSDLDAFIFEVVEERGSQPKADAHDQTPRDLYYMDWKAEELYKIQNASLPRTVSRKMITEGGLKALNLQLVQTDPEGERVIERILERDATVVPLIDEYLGYTPKPAEDLIDAYLEESEELLQELDSSDATTALESDVDASVRKESQKAYKQIVKLMKAEMGAEWAGGFAELVEELQETAPEEIPALLELLKNMKGVSPSHSKEVQAVFREQAVRLEKELQEDGRVLGELLRLAKRQGKEKVN